MRIFKLFKIVFNGILEAVQSIKDHRSGPGLRGR